MFLRDTNFPSVALFFYSRVFLTTESVFVLGFYDEIGFFRSCFCSCGFSHDEMPFCFGGSRRDAVLFWGFTTSDESNDESNDER